MADAKKTLRITQVKSSIGYKEDQGKTLRALGLGKINRSVEQVDNESVRNGTPMVDLRKFAGGELPAPGRVPDSERRRN